MILTADPSRRQLWTRALLTAAGIHAAAVGSLFVRMSATTEPSVDAPAIAVDMASPSSIPAPVHDVPTPRQVEAPKQTPQKQPDVKKLPFDTPPTLAVANVKPEVVVPPKKEAPPATEKASPLPPAPTTTELAAPDRKPDTKVAAVITGGATDGKATAADLWNARVRSRVELLKRYPMLAQQQNQQDMVTVLVTIDRSGRLRDARIRASQGFALLDDAALNAVRQAAPYPKPPKEIDGDPVVVSIGVRFFTKKR